MTQKGGQQGLKRTPRSGAPPPPSAVQGVPKGEQVLPKLRCPRGLLRLTGMLGALWQVIAEVISLTYLVLDGRFGNHHALQMALQRNLHPVSKLRCDAALYFPYVGPYAGRGPHRKYGSKVEYDPIPGQYLKETTVGGHIQTRLYQAQLLHKGFTQPLNVVILAKTNLRTQARAHVILFSSDLALAYAPLVDYYSLRFQIEFNFRDAKRYWGLEDFMQKSHHQGSPMRRTSRCSWSMWRTVSRRTGGSVPRPTVFWTKAELLWPQIRGRDDKNASGKAGAGFDGTNSQQGGAWAAFTLHSPLAVSRRWRRY